MFLIRWIIKLVLGLVFLVLFGLAVFTGSLLWKDDQLTVENFARDFLNHLGAVFEKTKEEVERKNEEWERRQTTPREDEITPPQEDLAVEKRDKFLREIDELFLDAKQQLAKIDPSKSDYRLQVSRTLSRFEEVKKACEKILVSSSFSPDEKTKIEAILNESRKQIYWANKFNSEKK